MKSDWKIVSGADFIDFNPRLSLKKGTVATKIAMDKLRPFTKKIPESEQAAFSGGAKFANGDTIMARITPCLENGKTAFVDCLAEGEIAFGSTEFIVLRAKEDVSDARFLYYLAISPDFRDLAIKSMVGTSGRQRVQQSVLETCELHVPPLETQRKIAAILSALDDKIELNRRINANLSALLETVYRVRFAADDMKRGGSLADICRYSAERVAVEELALDRYYSTENMAPEKAGALAAATLPAVANVVKCRAGDVLVSNIRPYFKKILYCQTDCGCSPDVLCFTPQTPELSAFLFATLYADEFFDFMVAGSKGTKMPRGDKKQIMTYPIAVPMIDELNEFNKLATPLLTEIENNRLENIALAAVRDALLPRLMSGEIDVDDVKF